MAEMKRKAGSAMFGVDSEEAILAQIEAAEKRPKVSEPAAKAVRFEPESRRVELVFSGDVSLGFGVEQVEELAEATDAELARLELSPSGATLSLRARDVDIAVDGLLLTLLGAAGWKDALRAQLNREVARITSEAKARAARENGKKGGRPRKSAERVKEVVARRARPQ
ncbi:MAG: DUF2442 domain-containing protein [Bacteriovoracia bacterium]